jgi:solute carrier family 25 2-oxodicarboxylate transporter 21
MFQYRDFIAGGLSGISEVTLTHWMDNIKTRRQEAQLTNSQINWNKLTIRDLYRGYIPRVAGIVPMRFVFWGAQSTANEYCQPLPISSSSKYLIAGGIAGATQSAIDNPIEVMKIKMMTSKSQIKFNELNLYRGFLPTLCRNVTFASVFNTVIHYREIHNHRDRFVTGAVGGFIASILSQPFDVVKTEIQRHGSNQTQTFSFLYKLIKNNPKTLFSGGLTRCILNCSTMSIGFVSVIYIKELLFP